MFDATTASGGAEGHIVTYPDPHTVIPSTMYGSWRKYAYHESTEREKPTKKLRVVNYIVRTDLFFSLPFRTTFINTSHPFSPSLSSVVSQQHANPSRASHPSGKRALRSTEDTFFSLRSFLKHYVMSVGLD